MRMRKARDRAVTALESGLEIRDDIVPGRHGEVPVRRYRNPSAGSGRIVVWVHGGAFSHGGLDQLESHAVAAALAQRANEVVAVDYRRVPAWSWFRDPPPGELPGTRYPVPLDEVSDVFAAVAARHPGAALGGASAGACLSAAVALRLARGGTPPAALLLAYGTFHAELPTAGPGLRSRIRGRHGLAQFNPTVVRRMNRNYAGSADAMRDPFAFPGGHDLTGMPPTLLVDADHDALRASGEAFAAELAAARVAIEHHVLPGATHGFLDRPGTTHFDDGIRLLADRLTTHQEQETS